MDLCFQGKNWVELQRVPTKPHLPLTSLFLTSCIIVGNTYDNWGGLFFLGWESLLILLAYWGFWSSIRLGVRVFKIYNKINMYPPLNMIANCCSSLLSRVQLLETPWTVACQASLSFIISWSSLKLLSLEMVMPSNHLIHCCPFSSCPQSFPASVFSKEMILRIR